MYVLGIVMHTFDPRTWKERQVDLCDFQSSHICIVRPYLKKNKVYVSVCLSVSLWLLVCMCTGAFRGHKKESNLLELHLKLLDVDVKNQACFFFFFYKSSKEPSPTPVLFFFGWVVGCFA